MNEHTKELCHWGLSLGEKKQGHKYVARVEGKRPGSYIYFYDLDKYNRWKQGAKTKINDAGNKLKSTIQNKAKEANKRIQSQTKKIKSQATETLKNGSVNVNDAVNKYKKYISSVAQNVSNEVENKKNELVRDANDTIKKNERKSSGIS